MKTTLREWSDFFTRCARTAVSGDWWYFLWVGVLLVLCLLGLNAYAKQLAYGLSVTGMSDHVSWGVYIANFTFLVGISVSAVMLVIPVYIYKNDDIQDLVIFGQLLAVAAIIMSLAFVTVDLGRPDRFWHLIPGIGKFNFPGSMLSWDVITLNGYLVLNIYLCVYLLFCRYKRLTPKKTFYFPVVFLGIFWAISVQLVEAFLFVGLGGRPFWNSAIVGPRFITSAFTVGPAIIILAMLMVRRFTATQLVESAPPIAGPQDTRRANKEDFRRLARHFPEIDSVSDEDIEACLIDAEVLNLKSGEVALRQADLDKEAYFVLEGRVIITRVESDRSRLVASVGRGEPFGNISALQGTPRTATATADGPTVALRLSVAAIRKLMETPAVDQVLRARMTDRLKITDRGLLTLRTIVQVSMLVNVFLLFNELFKEFYTDTLHVSSSQYLYLGLHGNNALVPWIWTAIACNVVAIILLVLPMSRGIRWLGVACTLAIVGIWIEKGMGLVVPGFIPSPLGEIVEYSPTLNETLISFGIWAFGLLLYTVMLRVAVPVMQGRLRAPREADVTAKDGPLPQPATGTV